MRQLLILVLIAFALPVVGCENSAESRKTVNAAEQQSDLSKESGKLESNLIAKNKNGQQKIDTSLYYLREYNPEKEFHENKITWKENDITFIANKSKSGENHTSDTIISSMIIEKGDKKHDIKLDDNPIFISSLSLSASDEYLAVKAFYHYGYKVIIINLDNGERFVLNEWLESNGEGFVETIHSSNWSPDGNKLAFSFGDTSKSRLAIYDLDNQTFLVIPTEINYITTAYILWHKNGRGLDFISEYPSEQYKLYRYYFDHDYVENITDVEKNDLIKLKSFSQSTLLHEIEN